MNKIFQLTVLALATIAASACNNVDNPPQPSGSDIQVSTTPIEFDAEGNVKAGSTATLTVTGADWTANSGENWITVAPAAGKNGETFTVTVTKNSAGDARNGSVVVSGTPGTAGVSIPVLQAASDIPAERFISGVINFNGDAYFNGESNFDMYLYTTELDSQFRPIGDGYFMYMDFFSEAPTTYKPIQIAPGKYEAKETKTKFTFLPGLNQYGTWSQTMIYDIENGVAAETPLGVSGGSFEVREIAKGSYRIDFDFTLSDGSDFKAYWEGPIDVMNRSGIFPPVEADVDTGKMVGKGRGSYYGVTSGQAHEYQIFLYNEDYNMDTGKGESHYVKLHVSTATGSGSALPSGTYPFSTSRTPGTLWAGTDTEGMTYGTWYIFLSNGQMTERSPLVEGQATVAQNGNIYTITYECKTDKGFTVKGSFEGELTIRDNTKTN